MHRSCRVQNWPLRSARAALATAALAVVVLAGSASAQDRFDAPGRAAAEATGVTGTELVRARGGPAIMALGDARPPGEWGPVALRTPRGGPRGVGTHNADGAHILLDCVGRDGVPTLYVGPLADPPAQVTARALVSFSDGMAIFSQDLAFEQVETGYLMTVIEPYLFWNLQDGGRLEIFLDTDDPLTFRLVGSREVLDAQRPCGADRIFPGAYAGHPALVLTGRWERQDRIVDLGEEPVLAFPARPPLAPEVLITCDHRLAIPSVLPGAPPYAVTLRIHAVAGAPVIAEVALVQGATDLQSAPLAPATIAALADGAYLEMTLAPHEADLLPITLRLGLVGTAALSRLSCPDPAEAGPLDLTDSPAGWAPVEVRGADTETAGDGEETAATADGDGGAAAVAAAQFVDDRAPALLVDCAGRPFFEVGSLPAAGAGGATLTLSVDGGDPVTGRFAPADGFLRPPEAIDALGRPILDGLALSVTGPGGLAVIYPLIGLQRALARIDCDAS